MTGAHTIFTTNTAIDNQEMLEKVKEGNARLAELIQHDKTLAG